MKSTGFRLLFGLLISGFLAACGGGGSNPPATPLSVTTTSLSQGQISVAYSATLSATGGTAPYNWSVKSGSLPAGLSLSAAGAISGTPTAAGASSFVAQVTDSKSGSASSGNLSIAISGGMLQITTTTAPTGTVGTAYPSFQLAATGGVPPYTWAVASGSSLPDGLSLSTAGVVTGTPTKAGTFNPSIAVTDETTTNTLSEPVNFTINPAGTPLPDGGYAFQFNGNTPASKGGNPVVISGSFLVVNGAVQVGAYSENELNAQPVIVQAFTGGSVSIAPNGLGQLVLDLPNGNITFALAVPASATTANNDSDIRIIEFDDTTGSGMRGSGVLKASSVSNVAPANLKGNYAFGFRGYDMHSQPVAVIGSFQADGSGNITSGSVDLNDNGAVSSSTSVTGTSTPASLGGLITLKIGSATLNFDYYQVSPTELLTTSADQTSATIPMVSGVVLQQTGPFTTASFTGANVLGMTGSTLQGPATFIPDVTLGLLTSDGKGNVSASYDEFKASLLPTQKYTGTYTVDATTGRTPITVSSATKAVLYLVSNTTAFAFGTDTSTSSGLVEAQSGSPFTNASLKGNYLGGTIPWPDVHVVSLVAADGNGNVQFTSDLSGSTGLLPNVTTSGTYSVDATGRAVLTVAGDSTPEIFYVVSPTRTVFLSGEAGGFLGSFEQ
ncbi:MAG TPA: putative Ig domain-containing protein [Acidobacteriaceae bacterium]